METEVYNFKNKVILV